MVRHNLLKLSSSFTETIDKVKREINNGFNMNLQAGLKDER
tara:strand:- start:198 stop:320 length:123 start_codon:yes stop_codon:yes gene_type:complete